MHQSYALSRLGRYPPLQESLSRRKPPRETFGDVRKWTSPDSIWQLVKSAGQSRKLANLRRVPRETPGVDSLWFPSILVELPLGVHSELLDNQLERKAIQKKWLMRSRSDRRASCQRSTSNYPVRLIGRHQWRTIIIILFALSVRCWWLGGTDRASWEPISDWSTF